MSGCICKSTRNPDQYILDCGAVVFFYREYGTENMRSRAVMNGMSAEVTLRALSLCELDAAFLGCAPWRRV